ncbi:hypothetical protein NQ318_007959 [Aromia moschata]|uniref:Protein-lysine N-methyltransferase SMYD4 n=1 Tax=Aromia moschata TaxID=1265417 RepID=A0AAV8YCB6_9CUCU|nr:hypothetical protein NQ318_007959 [Aromia moschata]
MFNTNKQYSVETIVQDLLRHLSEKQLVAQASEQFSSLHSNCERVEFAHRLLEGAGLFPSLLADEKCNEVSGNFRQKGNDMFKARKTREAIEFYTKGVAFAEDGSEFLALAYANRSAVLYERGLYEECLMDIDRALKNNYPEKLRPKLLGRQNKASQLKVNQIPQSYFQPIPVIPEKQKNDLIQCASDSVEIKYTEDLGRHVLATKDIAVGDVLAIEKPFCHILIDQQYVHCHECLKLCYNLIPCAKCTNALYCSQDCRNKSNYYHKFECPIMATTKKLRMDKLKLLSMKIATIMKNQYGNISNWYDLNINNVYRSDRYDEIHNLVANTEQRAVSDLFERSSGKYTGLLESAQEERIFKELVLLHLQTAACNFHEISEMAENRDGVYELEEIGAGAYSFLSMFNHCCSPNVVRHCYGPVIVVRAIQSIKKGEQCYDNYGYHHALMTRSERRSKLKKQYFFDCSCEVCECDWPLYHNLPQIETDVAVTSADLAKLQNGDVEAAKVVLTETLPKIAAVEKLRPNRNVAELQEVVKQCLALLGNVRRSL